MTKKERNTSDGGWRRRIDLILHFSSLDNDPLYIPFPSYRLSSPTTSIRPPTFSDSKRTFRIANMTYQTTTPGHQRPRVVLVAMAFQGHLTPLLDLAYLLHSLNFPITISHPSLLISTQNLPSIHPHFHFLPFSGFSDSSSFAGPTGSVELSRVADLIVNVNVTCKGPFREVMEGLREEEERKGGRVGCVVYDLYMFMAKGVSDELGFMSVGFRTGGGITLLAFVDHRRSGEGRRGGGGEGSALESPEKLDESGMENVYEAIEAMKAPSFTEVRSLVSEAIAASAAVILNTMEFLEHQALKVAQEALLAPILPIGPFHKITGKTLPNSLIKEDSSCISWLDKQQPRSVLYVSFGSIAAISEADIIEIAWGLEASKVPFLWVIRSGLIHGGRSWKDMLPTNMDMIVEDRGCIVSWVSQKRVLAHPAVGGFWSHCGWNSTLESVCEGVPMICTAFFGDQFADARYVTSVWKVGLELKNDMFERSKIERCVRRLMADKEGDEIRARAAVLKEKAESMLNGGASEKHLKRLEDLIMSD
ncbi:hypothetical protein Drorol1_Dr00004272 [Drosera rotundifolia]